MMAPLLAFLIMNATAAPVYASAGDSLTVDTTSEWWDNTDNQQVWNDVRTTIRDNQLTLTGENCIGWWPFDTDGSDLSSYQNDGTLQADAFITSSDNGKFDEAVSLDGTGDYVSAADKPSLDITGEITISARVKMSTLTGTSWNAVLVKGNAGTSPRNYGFAIYEDGTLQFSFYNGGWKTSQTSSSYVSAGSWYHLTITFDESTDNVNFYVGGDLKETLTQTSTMVTNVNSLWIGGHTGGQDVDGLVDETLILNRALSENEIMSLYNQTYPRTDIKEGEWRSVIHDFGTANPQTVDNLEFTISDAGVTENVYANIGSDVDNDGTIDDNTGWVQLSGSYWNSPSVQAGYRFQVGFKLETDNSTHSPTVDNYTINTSTMENFYVKSAVPDNSLVDRMQNVSWATPVLGTVITVDVVNSTPSENADNIADNARITVKDAGGNAVVSNQTTTDITIVDGNTKRFVFLAYNPDDALANVNLGAFSVFTEAWTNSGSYDNHTNSSAFTVDDFDNTVMPSQENLPGHRHIIYGTAARETGGSVTLTGGRRIDSNDGTVVAVVSGADFENTWVPSAAGTVYFELETAELDGRTDNLDYIYPNIQPEIISISVDNSLIDRDVDYAGSGADTNTTITVRIRDNDDRSDFVDAWIAVRDVLDALIDNENVFSTIVVVDENQIDVTMTYEATDNTLANNQLGAWDIWGYVTDSWGSTSEWQTSKFTVNDDTSTINFNPANPYVGWELAVSGTHSRIGGGAISVGGSWLIDNRHGQLSLGASSTYNETYTISNAGVGENMSVTIRVSDPPLDGLTISSYTTHENVKFQVWVRFEENYGLVGWIADENRPIDLVFEWDGGTHPYTLTSNPENVTVTAGGMATKIVKITDNDAYWRYVIPTLSGGDLTFVIVDDPTEVEQYRFFLQDYTASYGPPAGQMIVKNWIGTDLAEINSDFWNADWRMTAWLVTGIQYQLWVKGVESPLRLIGPIDAVVASEEKSIQVYPLMVEPTFIYEHVLWTAWRLDNNTIRAIYHDTLDNTIEARVEIRGLDNSLLEMYQVDNEWFTVTWTEAAADETYNVILSVTHGELGYFTVSTPIELAYEPPGVGPGGVSELLGMIVVSFSSFASIILMNCVGLIFDAPRAALAAVVMSLTLAFTWLMGWLPLAGGVYTVMLLIVMAILFALVQGRRRK